MLGSRSADDLATFASSAPRGIAPKGVITSSLSAQPSNASLNTPIGASINTVNTGNTDAPLGTGMGEDKTFSTRMTQFEREDANKPAWQTFIVYDTLKGLRKRGVPVDPTPDESLVNAFPASPDLNSTGCYVPRNRRGVGV
jgi:hypothetical protein